MRPPNRGSSACPKIALQVVLAGLVGRMRLAGEHELHRPAGAAHEAREPIGVAEDAGPAACSR